MTDMHVICTKIYYTILKTYMYTYICTCMYKAVLVLAQVIVQLELLLC